MSGKRTFKFVYDGDAEEVVDGSTKKLNNTESFDTEKYFQVKRTKQWRLIVRNLPFSCTRDDIESNFSKFGIIEEIAIPKSKKDPSSIAGFAFVQYRKQEQADEAMSKMNEREIKGRQIAVDWAVPKDQYMTAVLEAKEREKKADPKPISPDRNVGKKFEKKKSKKQSSPEDRSESKTDFVLDRTGSTVKVEMDEESDEDQDDDDEEESIGSIDDQDQKPKMTTNKRKIDQSTTVDGGFAESKKPRREDDVGEGRTIFVRNIPFDIVENDLRKIFEPFGALKYCLICKYPGTDQSKGSGFVQFVEKQSADKCLEKGSDEIAGLTIKGQNLIVCRAVSKESAHQMEKTKHDHQPKDKRNLHLLRVGLIRSGMGEASGVSAADMAKRMRVESANREKIKNFNIFVSPTRICVHNLPATVNDRELQAICMRTIEDDPNAWIKECRIMRDLHRLNAQGEGKSRGFGFVEFSQHEHALQCLKKLNNNGEIFGKEKRPIVEFSLENRKALLVKEQRAEKAKQRAQEQRNQPRGEVATQHDKRSKQKSIKPTNSSNVANRKLKKKFVPPTVGPSDGRKLESGTKRKAFPSHFGPKIRHRKRDAGGSKDDGKTKGKDKKGSKEKGKKMDGGDGKKTDWKRKKSGGGQSSSARFSEGKKKQNGRPEGKKASVQSSKKKSRR